MSFGQIPDTYFQFPIPNRTLLLQRRVRAGLTPASLLARLYVHATIENMKRDLVLLDYIIHVLCRKGVFFYYIKPRS